MLPLFHKNNRCLNCRSLLMEIQRGIPNNAEGSSTVKRLPAPSAAFDMHPAAVEAAYNRFDY